MVELSEALDFRKVVATLHDLRFVSDKLQITNHVEVHVARERLDLFLDCGTALQDDILRVVIRLIRVRRQSHAFLLALETWQIAARDTAGRNIDTSGTRAHPSFGRNCDARDIRIGHAITLETEAGHGVRMNAVHLRDFCCTVLDLVEMRLFCVCV